ncbi:MAG: hypothetical protein ACJAXZ_004567 [Akkermansiaceae bacterium]|jgi:hypothetical protein
MISLKPVAAGPHQWSTPPVVHPTRMSETQTTLKLNAQPKITDAIAHDERDRKNLAKLVIMECAHFSWQRSSAGTPASGQAP